MRTVAMANAGGGRGKTAITKKLASSLIDRYHKHVLIVDLDPLAGISSHFLPQDQNRPSRETMLAALMDPHVIPHAVSSRLSIFVGNETLNQADAWLTRQANPDGVLRAFFATWNQARQYDYCLLDCGPGLSGLTRNALVAADQVIVPQWVRHSANPDIAEHNVATTLQAAQRLRAEQALSGDTSSIPLVEPLDTFSDEDWQTLIARVMA